MVGRRRYKENIEGARSVYPSVYVIVSLAAYKKKYLRVIMYMIEIDINSIINIKDTYQNFKVSF